LLETREVRAEWGDLQGEFFAGGDERDVGGFHEDNLIGPGVHADTRADGQRGQLCFIGRLQLGRGTANLIREPYAVAYARADELGKILGLAAEFREKKSGGSEFSGIGRFLQ